MTSTQKEISIHYHPQDGAEWAKYLQSRLGEREFEIDIALNDVTAPDISRGRSRINVFLITPDFMDLTDLNIMKGYDHRYSLAILMGIETEIFTLLTTQRGIYEDLQDWITLDADESEESVRRLLVTIVTMYEYDYLPSRIRPVIMEPSDEGTMVYIGLERDTKSEVSVQFDGNKEVLKATNRNSYFYSFPLSDEEAHMLSAFSIVYKGNKIGEGQLNHIVPSSRQVNNPHSGLYAGHTYNADQGKQSKLGQLCELLEDETDPIGLVCKCMGMSGSDREQLDRTLANQISVQGFPEHLSLKNINEDVPRIQRDEKWPTFLHFAAEYNLMRFAEALLSYPALACACMIRNREGRTPDEIAHHAGHQELSEMLRIFSNFMLGPSIVLHDANMGETDGGVDMRTSDDLEWKHSTLNEERKYPVTTHRQPFDIRLWQETFKHKERGQGFFSKLLQRKSKRKKLYASGCDLNPMNDFQRKNTDVSRKYTHHDVPAERESGIRTSNLVSSESDRIENKLKELMHRVHHDARIHFDERVRDHARLYDDARVHNDARNHDDPNVNSTIMHPSVRNEKVCRLFDNHLM
ncbi:hypothetical protein ACJMK2_033337 [Sinanodonta woodiana]|uniref:DBB domain-containing protein n=1 Tax=Sinanodonta woodiana TaxID=1069815 RepID=A0ABD3WN29_SINWO